MMMMMMMTRGMERVGVGGTSVVRGSVVDESRMITAKISVAPHQGYFDYEQLQNNSPTSQLLSQVQKQFGNHLVTTWTTMMPQCVVNSAKNLLSTSHQSQSFKR